MSFVFTTLAGRDDDRGRPLKYPFDRLTRVGAEFFWSQVPCTRELYNSVATAARQWGERHNMQLRTRREARGVRVWRTK